MNSARNTLTATVKESRTSVRTRTYNSDPESVMTSLRFERFTGRVTIDMSQGGVCSVQVEDRTALPFMACNNSHA